MDFKKATDALCEGVAHTELAEALGVSVASVRQARLETRAKARRSPPPDWEKTVRKLALRRIERLQKLIAQIESAKP